MTRLRVEPSDLLDIATGFRIGRNAAVLFDGLLARVVGSGDERNIALEVGEQPAQIRKAAVDVFRRIEHALDAEAPCGFRDELHQPSCILR